MNLVYAFVSATITLGLCWLIFLIWLKRLAMETIKAFAEKKRVEEICRRRADEFNAESGHPSKLRSWFIAYDKKDLHWITVDKDDSKYLGQIIQVRALSWDEIKTVPEDQRYYLGRVKTTDRWLVFLEKPNAFGLDETVATRLVGKADAALNRKTQ